MPLDDVSHAAPFLMAAEPTVVSRGVDQKPLADRERFVLELFRHLAAFRCNYDEAALQAAARHVERRFDRDQADDVMAAAILLDNEMRCQTELPFAQDEPGAEAVTACEHDFLALLKAAALASDRAAIGACSRLEVTDSRSLLACARRLARALEWSTSSERATRSALPMPSMAFTGL